MTISIRPACASDLPLLRPGFAGDGEDQAANLQAQESGEGLYLVLWREGMPLGHLFLRWAGSHEIPRIRDASPVAAAISNCPALDGVWVRPECRSRGIGTQLIREAERLAQAAGYRRVCLTVDITNARARALYERLGYADPGIGPFHTFGTYTNPAGEEVPWDNGTQLFLMKGLAPGCLPHRRRALPGAHLCFGAARVDARAALARAGLDPASAGLEQLADGRMRLGNATPDELARFLDAAFTGQLGVLPFAGEDDYAVGAEWA